MNETAFKVKVMKDLATLEDCWVLKTQEKGRHGTPDLLICLKGIFVAIELKAEKGVTTKLQEYTLQKIRDAKGYGIISKPSLWQTQFEILKALK